MEPWDPAGARSRPGLSGRLESPPTDGRTRPASGHAASTSEEGMDLGQIAADYEGHLRYPDGVSIHWSWKTGRTAYHRLSAEVLSDQNLSWTREKFLLRLGIQTAGGNARARPRRG